MTYRDRIEAETATGHPAWPCPHCGYDAWAVERPWRKSKADRPCLFPATCGHCGVMETAHHVDGNWMGQHMYSRLTGMHIEGQSLGAFVQDRAEFLRAAKP